MTQSPRNESDAIQNDGISDGHDEYAAAAIDRVMDDGTQLPPLPRSLAAKIIADGERLVGGDATDAGPVRRPARRRKTSWWLNPAPAWGAACAGLLLALGISVFSPSPPGQLTAADLDQLLSQTPAASELTWQGMGDEAYANVSGYVRWDTRTQRGVMQFSGLPVNNPVEAQYQLWIVDPERDENPIDGGVFNVKDGDNLVAIDAKLQVLNPKAFAITLEQPGGVVVSAGPLLVIASS